MRVTASDFKIVRVEVDWLDVVKEDENFLGFYRVDSVKDSTDPQEHWNLSPGQLICGRPKIIREI